MTETKEIDKLCEELYPYDNIVGFPKDSLLQRVAFKRGFKTAISVIEKAVGELKNEINTTNGEDFVLDNILNRAKTLIGQ